MPFSDQSNSWWVINQVRQLQISSMLDVGAGSGTYGKLFLQNFPHIKREAIEVWKPYIYEYDLFEYYETIHNRDARLHDSFCADIVIFGDVLEHMTKEEAVAVWGKVRRDAKYALIGIPIVHYPQDAMFGNPYEAHLKDNWSHEEVLETFPEIKYFTQSDIVGSYIAQF